MSYLAECILGTLAAVGFICILKGVYDIIMATYVRSGEPATLFVSADGDSSEAERLLLAAERAKRMYLPHMEIVFLDQSSDAQNENTAARMAARRGITYLK